jgi:hypothetical protein
MVAVSFPVTSAPGAPSVQIVTIITASTGKEQYAPEMLSFRSR